MILMESLSSLIGAFIGVELAPRATRYSGDIVDDELAGFDLSLRRGRLFRQWSTYSKSNTNRMQCCGDNWAICSCLAGTKLGISFPSISGHVS